MPNVMKEWDEQCKYLSLRDVILPSKIQCHFMPVNGMCTQTKVSVQKLTSILIATKFSISVLNESERKNIVEVT